MGHSSGVLTAWEQDKGHLLVGGDMKVVRLWDATVERHLRVGPHEVFAQDPEEAFMKSSEGEC